MISWTARMVDRMFAVVGAFGAAQFPQVYQQYLSRLSGHVEELKYQVVQIGKTAAVSHKTIPEWVAKFQKSADADFALQGDLLQGVLNRFKDFQQAELALSTASIGEKPFLFIRFADKELLTATLKNFQFGFSFTYETLAYAFLGLVIGYSFFQMLLKVKTLLSKKLQEGI